MIYLASIIIVFMFNIVSSFPQSNGAIGFPEVEQNPLMVNKQNRHPVYIPSICPEKQLLYPGDQKDDWICDCRPGHLYHPETDECWPAYNRGPCRIGEYLILTNTSAIPVCLPNPCKKDPFVIWNGKCEMLGKSCGEKFPISVVGVNAATLDIDCLHEDYLISRFSSRDEIICFGGSKRKINCKC